MFAHATMKPLYLGMCFGLHLERPPEIREQRDLVRSGKKGAMPAAGCAYAKNLI